MLGKFYRTRKKSILGLTVLLLALLAWQFGKGKQASWAGHSLNYWLDVPPDPVTGTWRNEVLIALHAIGPEPLMELVAEPGSAAWNKICFFLRSMICLPPALDSPTRKFKAARVLSALFPCDEVRLNQLLNILKRNDTTAAPAFFCLLTTPQIPMEATLKALRSGPVPTNFMAVLRTKIVTRTLSQLLRLADNDPRERLGGIWVLGDLSDDSHVTDAIAAMLSDEDSKVRFAAITALGKRRLNKDHKSALANLLNDSNEEVKEHARQLYHNLPSFDGTTAPAGN